MSRTPKKKPKLPGLTALTASSPSEFDEVLQRIDQSRARAFAAVNQELVGLYGRIGEQISRKLESAAWGEGVVQQLADYLAQRHPDLKGFSRRNLFRTRQFYENLCG